MGSEFINGVVGYSVKINSMETIAAVLPLQEHWLPLSNLDLLLPPLDFGVFFCYKKNAYNSFGDFNVVVSDLKVSLAKALVTYYPFAGEVMVNSVGEPELLCNNRGVDFVVAYADVELEELNLHDPDESVESKLVPTKKEGVMCVQATELKCGGIVVACTFDHRIADAYSANMFLVAWAKISSTAIQGGKSKKPMLVTPSFRRSLLSPRRLGHYDEALDRLYMPISAVKMKGDANHHTTEIATNRIYCISSADIERMQKEASIGGTKRSKMEAFSAYLWRVIGKGAKKRNMEACNVCRMGIVVNGRCRLKQQQQLHPDVMDNYFGNVLSIPYGAMGLDDLEQKSMKDIADAVHDFLKEATNAEHFLGLIDWVEAHRPEPAAARIYLNGGDGDDDGVAFVVSSGRGFPVTEVEFGWGQPVFGSYHFPWGGSAGYVMPMPSAKGNGDWIVYVHLMKDIVQVLEIEAGHIFRPLTSEYFMSG